MSNTFLPLLSEAIQCNMLLVGKTGTGKSSFANYLFGTEVFLTGSGKPVTGWENNFQCYSLEVSGIQVNVYDSVGLEARNFSQWKEELYTFLKKHSKEQGMSRTIPPNQLMHVLFYTINAAGARIEPGEITLVKKIREEFLLPVSVVLTNCDIAETGKIETLEKEIASHGLESIRVCSIYKKTRGGTVTKQMGRDAALKKFLAASYEKVGRELSLASLDSVLGKMTELRRTMSKKIDDSDLAFYRIHKMEESFKKMNMEECFEMLGDIDDLRALIPPTFEYYKNFMESFNIEFRGRDILEEIGALIKDIDADKLLQEHSMQKMGDSLESRFNSDSLWDKVTALYDAGKVLLFIKSSLKEMLDEFFDLFEGKIRNLMNKIKAFEGAS